MIREYHPTEINENIIDFLWQSNLIEDENSAVALGDALLAWDAINQNTLKKFFGLADLLMVHHHLMQNLNSRIAGRFRSVDVRVGNKPCPSPERVRGLLNMWFTSYRNADTEELIKEAHIKFEGIHPFEDGNGRVGRIIMNWQRMNAGLSVLVIRADERDEYYKWFE